MGTTSFRFVTYHALDGQMDSVIVASTHCMLRGNNAFGAVLNITQ